KSWIGQRNQSIQRFEPYSMIEMLCGGDIPGSRGRAQFRRQYVQMLNDVGLELVCRQMRFQFRENSGAEVLNEPGETVECSLVEHVPVVPRRQELQIRGPRLADVLLQIMAGQHLQGP